MTSFNTHYKKDAFFKDLEASALCERHRAKRARGGRYGPGARAAGALVSQLAVGGAFREHALVSA
jgi:hypothetical protein